MVIMSMLSKKMIIGIKKNLNIVWCVFASLDKKQRFQLLLSIICVIISLYVFWKWINYVNTTTSVSELNLDLLREQIVGEIKELEKFKKIT